MLFLKKTKNNMEGVITFQNLTFGIGMIGTIFGVYHFFRNPTIKQDQFMVLLDERFKNHQTLADQLTKIEQNHLHTIEEHIKLHSNAISGLEQQIVRLTTIIDERIPKK